jgi:hypothetical protein
MVASLSTTALAEAAFTPSAVTFKVDDANKTITATVKLAFYSRSCGAGTSCPANAADVARISQAIEKWWNTGLMVRCYTFMVVVDARSIGSQSEGAKDEVDIGLDGSPEVLRGYVAITAGSVHGGGVSNPLGNTPADRIDAEHNPADPSTWPEYTYEQVYAHEFGHILGLEDNYDKTDPRKLAPGASEDLMFRKQGDVTAEMVKRVVDRSGVVNEKDLKCGWNISQAAPGGYTLKGLKCGDTDGEWTLQAVLPGPPIHSESTTTVTIPKGSLQGTFQMSTITESPGFITTINGKGTASLALQDDGSVIVHLDASTATSDAKGAGAEERVTLPIPAGQFTWAANQGKECAGS